MAAGTRVVVGIDLGLTGTGVAHYLWIPGQSSKLAHHQVSAIYTWPGTSKETQNTIYKVPTRVAYKAGNAKTRWGFECSPHPLPKGFSEQYTIKKYFKLFLDEELLEDAKLEDVTLDDVKLWFTDFLTELYQWIQRQLEKNPTYRDFVNRGMVEYLFSVPTTWTSQKVINDFKEVISVAGFRSASIDLTEAEAAAVSTLVDMNNPNPDPSDALQTSETQGSWPAEPQNMVGTSLIVCDAGGGTTDTTVLTINSLEQGVYRMSQEGEVEGKTRLLIQILMHLGKAIGSVQIDDQFKRLLTKRLNMLPREKVREIDTRTLDRFQAVKHEVGLDTTELLPHYTFQLYDSCDADTTAEEAKIVSGTLMLEKGEVKALFDKQIDGILELLDRQIVTNRGIIKYIALSGGLGSSAYVKQRIHQQYGESIKIVTARNPQLAVCKGLVIDRVQRLSAQIPMISRVSRASYGVLFREKYNKKIHANQAPVRDPLDGRKWVYDQIKWLISAGERINEFKPLEHSYERSVPFKTPEAKWSERVISYTGPHDQRPNWLANGALPKNVWVVRDFPFVWNPRYEEVRNGTVKAKWKKGWPPGAKFWRIKYELKIFVLPADLGFELWCGNRMLEVADSHQAVQLDLEVARDSEETYV